VRRFESLFTGGLLAGLVAFGAACGADVDVTARGDAGLETCAEGCTGLDASSDAPQMQIIALANEAWPMSTIDLKDGGGVPLLIYDGSMWPRISARIRGVAGGQATIEASLRTADGELKGGKGVVCLAPGEDGWAGPCDYFEFLMVELCPNSWTAQDVVGQLLELTVTVELDGLDALRQTMHVAPYCATAMHAGYCECVCAADYSPGMGHCPAPGPHD
jgi:hypothetical protein